MNDDYLWDKSGEADEEVERLEGLLSVYRHKPEPLSISALPPVTPGGRGFFKLLAVAAAAVLVVGLGIWMGLRQQPITVAEKVKPSESKAPQVILPQIDPPVANTRETETSGNTTEIVKNEAAVLVAQRRAAERRGRIAREKVLFALQVTSSKIQLIDRKLESDLNE